MKSLLLIAVGYAATATGVGAFVGPRSMIHNAATTATVTITSTPPTRYYHASSSSTSLLKAMQTEKRPSNSSEQQKKKTKKKHEKANGGNNNHAASSNTIMDDLWEMSSSPFGTLGTSKNNDMDTLDNDNDENNNDENASLFSFMGQQKQQTRNNGQIIDVHHDDTNIIMNKNDNDADSSKLILIGGTCLVLAAAWALAVVMGNDLGVDIQFGQLFSNPTATLDTILTSLEQTPPLKGMFYFSSFYILAEILAIPAVPILTASSGYLFGTISGTTTCLISASIAASISFLIGRTVLRGYVEGALANNPKFQSMDRAIEKEGFKLMLLLRLSPLFPFALSNYLYGASSIRFAPYFFGTLLGFAPGTFAYVYAGRIGKALTLESASSEPWYVYAGGMAVVVALLKIAGDVASGVIDAMEEEEEEE